MRIRFHLPDFTHNLNLNLLLYELMREFPEAFYEGVEIGSFYGEFPTSLWNGGRTLGTIFPEKEMRYCIDEMNRRGISLRYTFTNPLINKSHLDDAHCNRCLRIAQREDKLNGVIVVSEDLEHYVRKNYPGFQIISSTCKQIRDVDALCEELERFDVVVLDYNFNNQWEILEKLPHKERVELLCNAVCVPDCPRRRAHYQYLGRTQMAYFEHLKKNGPRVPFHNPESFECPYPGKLIYEIQDHSTFISPEDILEKYAPMGFENFKLEGRSSTLFNNMETYLYYMVKPEYRDKLRLIYLLSLQKSEIISVND